MALFKIFYKRRPSEISGMNPRLLEPEGETCHIYKEPPPPEAAWAWQVAHENAILNERREVHYLTPETATESSLSAEGSLSSFFFRLMGVKMVTLRSVCI